MAASDSLRWPTRGTFGGGAGQFTSGIQEFDPIGGFVRTWGSEGGGGGQVSDPIGVAVSGGCAVHVVDQGNARAARVSPP